jgi:hypothetical protein
MFCIFTGESQSLDSSFVRFICLSYLLDDHSSFPGSVCPDRLLGGRGDHLTSGAIVVGFPKRPGCEADHSHLMVRLKCKELYLQSPTRLRDAFPDTNLTLRSLLHCVDYIRFLVLC